MEDTDAKRSKIKELLTFIEERLAELESEKEELRKYQGLDRERRCLEYSIYQREQAEVNEALEDIEAERKRDVDGSDQKQQEFLDREKRIQDLSTSLREAEEALAALVIEKQQLDDEKDAQIKLRTQLQMQAKDNDDTHSGHAALKARRDAELQEILKTIESKEMELTKLTPDYESKCGKEVELSTKLDDAEAEQQTLYSKQGRYAQFKVKSERDAWLKKEIKNVQDTIVTHTTHAEELNEDLGALKEHSEAVTSVLTRSKQELAQQKSQLQNLQAEERSILTEIQTKTDQRKDLWREESKLSTPIQNAKEELQKAERNLSGNIDRQTRSGLAALPRIVEQNNIRGCHGPLYELFEVDDTYGTAVEVTAGTSLFHVVVDDDHVAAKILEHLNREKAGRVTFMPLNRLRPKAVDYPQANDAIAMVKKLRFNKSFEKAFQQVFGKTIICPNLQVASAYSRSHKVNAITLDGDRAERKGALTGGYIDNRRSRLEAVKSIQTWKTRFESLSERLQEVKRDITRIEQSITGLKGKQRKAESQRLEILGRREPLLLEYHAAARDESVLRERLENKTKALQTVQSSIRALNMKVTAYNEELKTDLLQTLSPTEQASLERLTAEIALMRAELMEISTERARIEQQKTVLQDELEQNLYKRRDELESKIAEVEDETDDQENIDPDTLQVRMNACEKEIASLEQQSSEVSAEMEAKRSNRQSEIDELDKLQNEQAEDVRGIEKHQKTAEKYLAKRRLLLNKREECMRSIRDLGVLPEEAFEKFVDTPSQKLVKQLHKVNDSLKKYSHVNKKAFEQYGNFTKQRDTLLTRRTELDESAGSIQDLISVLDQRKDEAIERTFKQVARNFAEVFEKLVPAGKGQLVMQRRFDRDQQVDGEDEQGDGEGGGSGVESYTGVAIKVSFTSKTLDEGLRIQQLSGGQKSLCALAMIFAIQKCDPAPFYLFDEIDANLDAQYRTSVAAMIDELSENAQFITTTFRSEMLAGADQFYGVLFTNKVSSVRAIERGDAMEFVDQEQVAA